MGKGRAKILIYLIYAKANGDITFCNWHKLCSWKWILGASSVCGAREAKCHKEITLIVHLQSVCLSIHSSVHLSCFAFAGASCFSGNTDCRVCVKKLKPHYFWTLREIYKKYTKFTYHCMALSMLWIHIKYQVSLHVFMVDWFQDFFFQSRQRESQDGWSRCCVCRVDSADRWCG